MALAEVVILLLALAFPWTVARPDERGYIAYCPCMGRFGNQADHFLGALRFAKDLDRTLIIPPWVEYEFGMPRATMVPFSDYFSVSKVGEYHRVIAMEDFMRDIAPEIWPKHKRLSFCYGPRKGIYSEEVSCNAKDGNPFGPFWDYSGIDFVNSEYYAETIGHDAQSGYAKSRWDSVYAAAAFPVLAFTGAPARFPVAEEDRALQAFLHWAPDVRDQAAEFAARRLTAPVLALHLRNDRDWDNVCTHVGDGKNHLFASPQCLGYGADHAPLTQSICAPSREAIVKQVVAAVKQHRIASVFVAADRDHMIERLNGALKPMGVKAFRQEQDEPHVSLAILGSADFFIGNCVSSFSAFAKRERDVRLLPSAFWGFGPTPTPSKNKPKLQDQTKHSEL